MLPSEVCKSHSNRGKADLLLKEEDKGLCQLWRQDTSSRCLELLPVQHCFPLPLVGEPDCPLRIHLCSSSWPGVLARLPLPPDSSYDYVTQAWTIQDESCDTD